MPGESVKNALIVGTILYRPRGMLSTFGGKGE